MRIIVNKLSAAFTRKKSLAIATFGSAGMAWLNALSYLVKINFRLRVSCNWYSLPSRSISTVFAPWSKSAALTFRRALDADGPVKGLTLGVVISTDRYLKYQLTSIMTGDFWVIGGLALAVSG